jgi:tight adherence protein C
MILYLASAGFVCSLFVLRWGFVGGQRTHTAARAALGPQQQRATLTRQGASGIAELLNKVPGLSTTDDLSNRIAKAGLGWSASKLQFMKATSLVITAVLGVILGVASGSLAVVAVFVFSGLCAAVLPDFLLRTKGDERQRELELQLPDILDRLTISMEAGLGFDTALAHVVRDRRGPGYDEFRRVLQDLQLGVPRTVALNTLSERTSVSDLRIVLSAVQQSSKYGLPLANVLRVQTAELRDKRWARAQESAMKIPVKVLLPLIFCILPTLFLVIIGPAIIRISRSF